MRIGNEAVRDFLGYLKILTDDRRRNPGDPDKDVLTRLINGEHEGRKLTETELLQNCIFILNAGHETTTNLIGNALYTFLQYPEQMQRVMDDPSLMQIGGRGGAAVRKLEPARQPPRGGRYGRWAAWR